MSRRVAGAVARGAAVALRAIPAGVRRLIGSIREGGGSLRRGMPEQITRLATVFVLGIAGVLAARTWLVPERFKDVALNHRLTIERERARAVKFAGATSCAACHEEQVVEKREGFHRDLGCETCHGPCFAHTQEPTAGPAPYAPRLRDFCVRCHTYDASRPTGFPQINPITHNAPKPCIDCHEPHSPEPPMTPKECGACHGEIDNTKAVSAHATLSCTICHETPEDHKLEPHRVRPQKPETREFCGQCHAPGSTPKAAPKVEIATHGEKYQCWECHYPHMPEGR